MRQCYIIVNNDLIVTITGIIQYLINEIQHSSHTIHSLTNPAISSCHNDTFEILSSQIIQYIIIFDPHKCLAHLLHQNND